MTIKPEYQKIWKVIQQIPQGKVASYGQIADLAGLPGRARLVGKCLAYLPKEGYNGKSVPWFKVLRSSGQIAFEQSTHQFTEQRALLMDEGIVVNGRRVSIKQYGWQPNLMELLFVLEE